MKQVHRTVGIASIVLLFTCGSAWAGSDTTRDRVRAELAAARQAGALSEGEPEIAPRGMFPWLYPASDLTGPPSTRAEVHAEAVKAVQTGTQAGGFGGMSKREVFPGEYPISEAARSLAHSGAPGRAN